MASYRSFRSVIRYFSSENPPIKTKQNGGCFKIFTFVWQGFLARLVVTTCFIKVGPAIIWFHECHHDFLCSTHVCVWFFCLLRVGFSFVWGYFFLQIEAAAPTNRPHNDSPLSCSSNSNPFTFYMPLGHLTSFILTALLTLFFCNKVICSTPWGQATAFAVIHGCSPLEIMHISITVHEKCLSTNNDEHICLQELAPTVSVEQRT